MGPRARLEVVAGATRHLSDPQAAEEAARLAVGWFGRHLVFPARHLVFPARANRPLRDPASGRTPARGTD